MQIRIQPAKINADPCGFGSLSQVFVLSLELAPPFCLLKKAELPCYRKRRKTRLGVIHNGCVKGTVPVVEDGGQFQRGVFNNSCFIVVVRHGVSIPFFTGYLLGLFVF
jgi:hypothetical protein